MDAYYQELQLFLAGMYPIEQAYVLSPEEKSLVSYKKTIFEAITQDFTTEIGEEISLNERENITEVSDMALTYGEIDFNSISEVFYTIIHRYQLPSGIFYDLGSGMGKCVIAASLLHNFSKCKGIEILQGLYECSLKTQSKFQEHFNTLPSSIKSRCCGDIEYINADILNYNWTDASIIFANSTCFGSDMMKEIGKVELNIGVIGISFTEVFIGDGWIILESIRKNMSWGQATVYIQRYIGKNARKIQNNPY